MFQNNVPYYHEHYFRNDPLIPNKGKHFQKTSPAILYFNLIIIQHSRDNVLPLAIKVAKSFFKLALRTVLISVICKSCFHVINRY